MAAEPILRRLQRVGKATFSISLPKRWVRERGLRPGDLLEIREEVDGSLRIGPTANRVGELSYIIDAELCKFPGELTRLITSCYRNGCDRIVVRAIGGLSEDHLREAENAVRILPGLEIIERTNTKIIIQNLIDPSKFPMKGLIRRFQAMILTMFGGISDFLLTRSYENIKSIRELREKLHQLHQLVIRLIILYLRHRHLGKSIDLKGPSHAYHILTIMDSMIRIVDDLYEIGEGLLHFRKSMWRDEMALNTLREFIEIASAIFEGSISAFIKVDLQRAINILNQSSNFLNNQLSKIHNVKKIREPGKIYFREHFYHFLRDVIEESRRIVEMTFDEFLESENPLCILEDKVSETSP